MRDIKFRALRDDLPCFFVYGYLLYGNNGVPRIAKDCGGLSYTCLKGTVGQYTGLKDKNGVEIYEGDKISISTPTPEGIDNIDWYYEYPIVGVVIWGDEYSYPAFTIDEWDGESNVFAEIFNSGELEVTVIGNIHEVDNEKTME